jgi:hypothetical protein
MMLVLLMLLLLPPPRLLASPPGQYRRDLLPNMAHGLKPLLRAHDLRLIYHLVYVAALVYDPGHTHHQSHRGVPDPDNSGTPPPRSGHPPAILQAV